MKQIQGAEATVTIKEKEVEKDRKKKQYRHPELDKRIRTERNKQEARVLQKARQNGVKAPEVVEESETEFKMQKIKGKQLKQIIEEQPSLIEELAVQVARLHSVDIIHGDLTTSNAIAQDQEVYMIDFGLAYHSERVEDKAVDLHLLKNILETSHADKEELWSLFSEKYGEEGSEEVLDKLPEIEERARYK
ncbi:KEOPS complex kinase/ATPase Bud32 [Candidatus Nanohalobium constans]|uniref:non-specific serine/threonine protein kinase n=1 Tax=Candidatus Nanohalobium constans TaxID=2565781 RepID=A0A5Q0UGD6_9ARCH|nr:KEOPS complex kinase/ATPase Bud32 [Candidatus Nanohalobium constans]QGA80654.1 bifunctional N6-L-threonylcarbamoyladenine synthase / protein kinase Bud32 [Candidatus Nanohalobium constans]